jgi:cation diffusion facilitator CzcD-associated flavoprotein CzcO
VVGARGRTLAQEWGELPRAYLGLSVPGFPNMFLLYGPNTNGGTGSVIYTIEAGMRHVLAALRELESRGAQQIEVRPEALERFDRELREALAGTVWHTGCQSWYLDEHGNDPNQWPWLWREYRRRTERLAPGAYELRRATPVPAGAVG